MPKAIWSGVVLAESEKTEMVEGNHYFPPESVTRQYFKDSSTHTTCPWKGVASYYDLDVNGQVQRDAAWTYPTPNDAAKHIANHVAFSKSVKIEN